MSDEREKQLRQDLGDCAVNSSYLFCVAGLAIAVPLGVRQKSYFPVLYMGLAGSLLDLIYGYDKCKEQREALEGYLRSREAFGKQATSLERQLGDSGEPE